MIFNCVYVQWTLICNNYFKFGWKMHSTKEDMILIHPGDLSLLTSDRFKLTDLRFLGASQ